MFERAARRPSASRALARRRRRPTSAPVLDAAELAVTLRRTRAGHLDRLRERARPATCRCSTCPYLFTRAHGVRATRQVAEALGRGAGLLMAASTSDGAAPARIEQLLAAKEIVISLRLRRRRQDHHRGGRGGRWRRSHLGGKVLVLTVDPAKRLANALGLERFGNVETRVPAEAFTAAGVEPRGELWAAMLDTKQSWDDLVRAPRARHADPRRDPRQPALPEHHRPVRAEPRLHRHGAALRDPHRRATTT